MTPLGHLTVSYITGKSVSRISMAAIIVGGLIPDSDFLFILSDGFNQAHRVVSHNLFFVITASLIACLFASSGRKSTVALSMFTGGMLHLIIDSIMDNNPSNGVGVALLWPLSDLFFSPFNLLHASMNNPGWSKPVTMMKSLIPGMLFELPFYFVSAVLFLRRE